MFIWLTTDRKSDCLCLEAWTIPNSPPPHPIPGKKKKMKFVFETVEIIERNGALRKCWLKLITKATIVLKSTLTLSQTSPGFTCLQYKSFENTVGKGEIAHSEQFLLFPTVFSTSLENFLRFSSSSKLSSADTFSLEESKICRLGKG